MGAADTGTSGGGGGGGMRTGGGGGNGGMMRGITSMGRLVGVNVAVGVLVRIGVAVTVGVLVRVGVAVTVGVLVGTATRSSPAMATASATPATVVKFSSCAPDAMSSLKTLPLPRSVVQKDVPSGSRLTPNKPLPGPVGTGVVL